MKTSKTFLKKKKTHLDRVADKLVNQHKKNEELSKRGVDLSEFTLLNTNQPPTR